METSSATYSSGLLDDFSSAKRSWKPKKASPTKIRAKSADAELPKLFATVTSRSPMRKKGSESPTRERKTLMVNSSNEDKLTVKQSRPIHPPVSDERQNVPSLFKVAASPAGNLSKSPDRCFSPGKYKAKIVVRKRENNADVSSPPSSLKGSKIEAKASDTKDWNVIPSPPKPKIKIKSRSNKFDSISSPRTLSNMSGRVKVIDATSKELTEPRPSTRTKKPKSPNNIDVSETDEKIEGGVNYNATSINLCTEGLEHGAEQREALGDSSPKRQPKTFQSTNEAIDFVRTTRTETSSKRHEHINKDFDEVPELSTDKNTGFKDADHMTGDWNDTSQLQAREPMNLKEIKTEPTIEITNNVRSMPRKLISSYPQKDIKNHAFTSTPPNSSNKVAPETPRIRSFPPPFVANTTTSSPTASPAPKPTNPKFHDTIGDNNHDKVPLVTIDTSGSSPQMIISFDNNGYNPIDEDELSCSVATSIFRPPDTSRAGPHKDPAAIVGLLSREEQLELFKTLEMLHRKNQSKR